MHEADEVVSNFTRGTLDRRSAVKRLLAAGMTAPAAYSMLGYVMVSPSEAVAQSARARSEDLKRVAEAFTRLLTSTEMVEAIDQADKIRDKRDAASFITREVYKPDLMKRAGLNSDFLRTSLRVFEIQKDSQQPLTLGIARAAGPYWTGKFEVGGRSRLTDEEFEQGLSNDPAGREAFRKGETRQGALPETGRIDGGVCVSFGRDLCVSAGVP